MINRSFVLLPAILCCVCLIGQLHAQITIENPAANKPNVEGTLIKPATIEPAVEVSARRGRAARNRRSSQGRKDSGFLNTKPASRHHQGLDFDS